MVQTRAFKASSLIRLFYFNYCSLFLRTVLCFVTVENFGLYGCTGSKNKTPWYLLLAETFSACYMMLQYYLEITMRVLCMQASVYIHDIFNIYIYKVFSRRFLFFFCCLCWEPWWIGVLVHWQLGLKKAIYTKLLMTQKHC